MPMMTTMQSGFHPMRPEAFKANDVTADDTFLDGTTTFIADLTARDVFMLGPETNGVEIMFDASTGVDGDTFSVTIWEGVRFNSGKCVALQVCDCTGAIGAAFSPRSDRFTGRTGDGTRYICGDLTITAQYHTKTVGIANNADSSEGPARLVFDTLGAECLYAEFSAVGGANEVENIMPWIRTF